MTREEREKQLRELQRRDFDELIKVYTKRCVPEGQTPHAGIFGGQMIQEILDKEFPRTSP